MKAKELMEKLQHAIDVYGADCEVAIVEDGEFGSDRYGIGVGLVAAEGEGTIDALRKCSTQKEHDAAISGMTTLMKKYFGGECPLW